MAAAASSLEAPPFTPTFAITSRADAATEQGIVAAERLIEAGRHDEAVALLDDVPEATLEPELELRFRLALSWAEMYCGRLERARELLARAESVVRSPRFDASERAEVLFRQGCVVLKGGDVAEAFALFTHALAANARSTRPDRALEARAYEWRARCHVLRRDFGAARRDAERSLELASELGDQLLQAHALFQASIVAERERQWLLARCYAEQALAIYEAHGDRLSAARILNNLGGLQFLLGDHETAEQTLATAVRAAAGAGSAADSAQAASSLAQIYLRTGRATAARELAQTAVARLEARTDFLDELGNAQLIVAQALAAEGDHGGSEVWLDRAEAVFTALHSASHLAAVWIARGDLAREQGDIERAATLYRRAAEVLQDFHF